MHRIYLLAFSLLFLSYTHAQLPNVTVNWTQTYHPKDSMDDNINSTVNDIYGNIYTVGYKKSVDTSVTFVSKTDASGQLKWVSFLNLTPWGVGPWVSVNNHGAVAVLGLDANQKTFIYLLDSNGIFVSRESFPSPLYYPDEINIFFKLSDDSTFVLCTGNLSLQYFTDLTFQTPRQFSGTPLSTKPQDFFWDSLGNTYVIGRGAAPISYDPYFSLACYNSSGTIISSYVSDSLQGNNESYYWTSIYSNIYVLTGTSGGIQSLVTLNAGTCQPTATVPMAPMPWLRHFKASQNKLILAGCDANNQYIRLAGMDLTGNILWQDSFSNNTTTFGYNLNAIDYDSSGIYLAGTQSALNDSSVLNLKYDYNGNLLWSKITRFISQPAVKGIYVYNTQLNTVINAQNGAEGQNLWFLNSNSADTSTNSFITYDTHQVGDLYFTGVVKDFSGNIYCTGKLLRHPRPAMMILEKLNPAGNLLWLVTDTGQGQSLVIDSINGNVIVVGNSDGLTRTNMTKVWRYDYNGNEVTKRSYNFGFPQIPYISSQAYRLSCKLDHNNDLLIYGINSEEPGGIGYTLFFDFSIIKCNPQGDTLWTFLYPNVNAAYDFEPQLFIDDSNNVAFFYNYITYLSSEGSVIHQGNCNTISRSVEVNNSAIYDLNVGGLVCLNHASIDSIADYTCTTTLQGTAIVGGYCTNNMFVDRSGFLYLATEDSHSLILTKVTTTGDSVFSIKLPGVWLFDEDVFMSFDGPLQYYTDGYFDEAGNLIFIINNALVTTTNAGGPQTYANISVYVIDTLGNIVNQKLLLDDRLGPDQYRGSIFDYSTNVLLGVGSEFSEHGVKAGMLYSLTVNEPGMPNPINGVNPAISFSVFPNPCDNYIEVAINEVGKNYAVGVFDLTGREIIKQISMGQRLKYILNTTTLSPGVYLVQVVDESGNKAVKKVVKQ